MLDLAAKYKYVMNTLPELERERLKLPRAYLANVLYTQLGERFKQFVQEGIDARNERMAEKHDHNLLLDADIGAIFLASANVSGKLR